ncbi:ABC transporter substrate-binding protein [Actinoallomurus purpureus]|uniref:ABC transporter substrate-binding protein n=1 Tax=Actinoallomurus purpureus TaxID=478114 RepID=UPI002093856D|nr:ABC transporter substrate-binding protein [Actinoallomurus purpureus]MCO6007682.1 ABC transporter substrate-binding protein [Actinoallomurus purpureus]
MSRPRCRLTPPVRPLPPPRGGALRPRPLARRLIATGLTALTAAFTLSACQDSDPASALGRVKKADKIFIATDALYPPNEFKQGEQIVGFDVDLGTAIARKLGVKPEFQDVKFESIMPALSEGKYDLSLSSFTDTKERESRLDFVTYLSAGTMLLVRKGNPKRLRPDDLSLCGKRVAVEKGTTQEDELTPESATKPNAGSRRAACKNAGRPAPIGLSFDDQAAANAALAKGRADGVLADAPSVTYGAKQSAGRLEVSGQAYGNALYGIAIPKHHDDLRGAVFKAVKELMNDGVYKRITEKWGISGGAVTEPKINAAQPT